MGPGRGLYDCWRLKNPRQAGRLVDWRGVSHEEKERTPYRKAGNDKEESNKMIKGAVSSLLVTEAVAMVVGGQTSASNQVMLVGFVSEV